MRTEENVDFDALGARAKIIATVAAALDAQALAGLAVRLIRRRVNYYHGNQASPDS